MFHDNVSILTARPASCNKLRQACCVFFFFSPHFIHSPPRQKNESLSDIRSECPLRMLASGKKKEKRRTIFLALETEKRQVDSRRRHSLQGGSTARLRFVPAGCALHRISHKCFFFFFYMSIPSRFRCPMPLNLISSLCRRSLFLLSVCMSLKWDNDPRVHV